MFRKPTNRRSLHLGPKVKLPSDFPLPGAAEDMAVKIDGLSSDGEGDIVETKNPYGTSDLAASLPDVRRGHKNNDFYFDSYISDIETDQENDDCCSLFNDSEASTLGQSSSSFMSWMDEAELEKSKEVQRLVDEVDDAIYDSTPFPVTDQKALDILGQIKDSQLHLRLVGEQLHKFPQVATIVDEDAVNDPDVIEVIATHGIYNDCDGIRVQQKNIRSMPRESNVDILQVEPEINLKYCDELPFYCETEYCDGALNSCADRTDWDEGDGPDRLLEKLKGCVLDQLVNYIFSEAVKSCDVVRNVNISSLSDDEDDQRHFSSPRPNTREDVEFSYREPRCVQQQCLQLAPSISAGIKPNNDFLHVSSMAIHQIPRKSATRLRYPTNNNFELPLSPNHSPLWRNSFKREFNKPELTAVSPVSKAPPISIIPLLRSNSMLPRCTETEKGIQLRGYRSAAVGKKSGLWDRRFSITAGHERFLEPLMEPDKHSQQASAPSTPAKWLRRHTLPPINANGTASHRKNSMLAKSKSSVLTAELLQNSKNKVSMSRMPMTVEQRKMRESQEQPIDNERSTSYDHISGPESFPHM